MANPPSLRVKESRSPSRVILTGSLLDMIKSLIRASKAKEVAEDAKEAVEGAIKGVKNIFHKDDK